MSFSDKLKPILKEKKVKLSQLCRDTGLSYNTIQNIIKRDTNIMDVSVRVPITIAKYLGIDVYELIGEEAGNIIREQSDSGLNPPIKKIEIDHIQKYRALDEHGQRMVNIVTDEETSRITKFKAEQEAKAKAKAKAEAARKLELMKPEPEDDEESRWQRVSFNKRNALDVYLGNRFDQEAAEELWPELRLYESASSAGVGVYHHSDNYEMMRFPPDAVDPRADFGVPIEGHSMEPYIMDGDIVFVQSCVSIDSGEIGIFTLENDTEGTDDYCKKLSVDYEKGETWLVSLNDDYDDILIGPEDKLWTIGRVVGVYRPEV